MKNLQERLRDVFSVLEQHNPHVEQPIWNLSDSAVREEGHSPSDSEDEDDDDVTGDHNECVEVLRMVEDEEGEAVMACKMPSSSACKAFNQEDEEDAFDTLACESLQRLRCRPKPALKTQVAERNIYDRMMCSSPSYTPVSPTCPANTPTLAQLTAPIPTTTHSSVRKKVRFREEDEFYDAPTEIQFEDSPMQHSETGPSPQLRQKLISGEAGAAAPRETDSLGGSPRALVPSAGTSQSTTAKAAYVPEHVRRPEAFTCYELDTPVVVGSGFDGSADPLTAGPASAQAALGSSGRVFSGINRKRPGALKGCMKHSNALMSTVEASNLRFVGLSEAEYVRSSAAAAQHSGLSAGASDAVREGDESNEGAPEMVAFVPGKKSARSRARSDLGGATVELLQGKGEMDRQGDDAMTVIDSTALAAPSSVAVSSQFRQRSRGVLSVSAADDEDDEDDVMETDDREPLAVAVRDGEGADGAMQLACGTVCSALTDGLSSLGGVEAESVSMRDGGMTFEFPMDSSQQTVGGMGVFGGGVGFMSAPVSRGQKTHRRDRRQEDE